MVLSLRVLCLNKIYSNKIVPENLTIECYDLCKIFKFINEGKYFKKRIIKNILEIMNHWYYILNLINKIPKYQLYEFKDILQNDNIKDFFYILDCNDGIDISNSIYVYDCIAYRLLLEKSVFHIIENLGFYEYNRTFVMMYIRKNKDICNYENNKTHKTYLYLTFRLFLNERFGIKDFVLPMRRITFDYIEHYEFPLTIGI